MGNTEDTRIASLLSGIWPGRNSRPSRKTIWVFAALAVVLQGLLLTKWFFYDEDTVKGPSYDIEEIVELVTAVGYACLLFAIGGGAPFAKQLLTQVSVL